MNEVTFPTKAPSKPVPTEHTLLLSDKTELFYRAWVPASPTEKALLLFHRGHEHSGRWQETVEALALDDVSVFAWDARGHGRSSGPRGSAESFSTVVKDVDEFVRHIRERHGIALENMVVLAHSVGAVGVAAWVHDYAPPIRGMLLATPAFRVKLYVPFAIPFLRLRRKLFGHGYVKSYVKARMLTHDPEQAVGYDADKLIFRQIAVNILLDMHDISTRLLNDAGAISVPVLVLAAESDWIVKRGAQRKFFAGLSSLVKQFETLPGFYHAIFHEKHRNLAVAKARRFIVDCFEHSPEASTALNADRRGYTENEYDRLRGPGNPLYLIVRSILKTVGRLSRGVRLGWQSGFDSGLTLDYVYQNRPQGFTILGRAIDRAYLNSIGWRGIRRRKEHLVKALGDAIEKTHAMGKQVRILDIASGPGRYVLETIRQLKHIPASVFLRDYKIENVEAARQLAKELSLENVTVTPGDAFDRASLAAVTPRPSIGIVSGLYELFPENEPVYRSLCGLADVIEPGGYLIYTNQPWHPQVEFIARVLVNREGNPWVMRRRTQAEMDGLVRSAGFEKLSQEIDPWGIFTVSVARRVAS